MDQLAGLPLNVYCISVRMLRNTLLFILCVTFNMAIVRILSSSPRNMFTDCSCANTQFLLDFLAGNLETFLLILSHKTSANLLLAWKLSTLWLTSHQLVKLITRVCKSFLCYSSEVSEKN